MAHLKRHIIPKNWPIPRKGTTFVVRPTSKIELGVPILIALRDMLKQAEDRREVKKAIHNKLVRINDRLVRDEKNTLSLFDTLTLIPSNKSYRLTMNEFGKFEFENIKPEESFKKVAKVIDKKVLKGKKTQINLSDGRNYLIKDAPNYKTNDSVVVNLKDKKIEKKLELKKGAKVFVFQGKHTGKFGTIKDIDEKHKRYGIELKNKETISVLVSFLIVVE
ncbi:hypothetical protein COU57_04260 [Candidatus Pacearchaeota archaeon CG10_big_fil_rev_8_21_14_0_10_32_14]|nr:MAG: hypothetical protein COU57_04260 [Candidatus Pacearchaeota archaeon CG10_big_fil_rev_8_21_14_0_10_32_14]